MAHDGSTAPADAAPDRPICRPAAAAALPPLAIDLTAAEPIPAAARDEIARLLDSGDLFRYTNPAEAPAALLEAEFAALTGAGFALAVTSCSAAMFLALAALDLPAGARVLVPALTFAAVPSAVIHAGLRPELVECGADFRIDPADLARRIDGAGAVLVSHMRGHSADMDRILALAAPRGIPVIEDAAHALGARWHGRMSGRAGRVGCYSFQSYKLVNAGEGGMLVTDDPGIAARAAILSGAYEGNWASHPGLGPEAGRWQGRLPLYNMRMQNLSAAVIRAQLPLVEARAAAGRAAHDRLAGWLADAPWARLPAPLPPERRAPDSFQFTLEGTAAAPARAAAFAEGARALGLPLQIFGLAPGNARAFWNWHFLGPAPGLPATRDLLMRGCDLRLPGRLTRAEVDAIGVRLLAAAAAAFG